MVIKKQNNPINILLAFDGSPASWAGVSLLRSLALPPGSQVTLLGVGGCMQAAIPLDSLDSGIVPEWRDGEPSEQIIAFAGDHHCDLIVLGATGSRGMLGVLLGSVALRVVEGADRPVLVVRPPGVPLNNIVLATDGSHQSLQAAGYLGAFPLPAGCRVMILHVIPPLPETADALKAIHHRMSPNRGALLEFEARSEFTSLRESEERRGHLALKTTLQALNHTMFGRLVAPEVNSALLEGDPAEEIIDFAHETGASLIVAGSRGLSQVKGWLLGSVSRKLIQLAPCSVLLVRGVTSSGEAGKN